MSKKYRLGVLGLGEGRSVLSAAQTSKHYELARICDLNEALCLERVEEFHLPLEIYTTDYQEMLSDPTIDVIGIYTPDPFHGKHIQLALEAGKHVICTKPVLTRYEDAKDLLALSKKVNRQVFVGQSSRFFEPMRMQRKDFEEGLFGELTCIETFYKTDARWFLEKGWSLKSGFSWMYNFLIHAVDLACWYLPDIAQVYSITFLSQNTKDFGLDIPDVIKCLFKDTQGRIAQIEGSYATPSLDFSVEPSISCTIRGTKGISRGEYPNLKYHTHLDSSAPITQDLESLASYYFRFAGVSHHAGEYQNYMDYFATSLDQGIIAKPDLAEATQILKIMTAIEKSAETGLPVKMMDFR